MIDTLPFGSRRFVIFLHDVPRDGSFSLNDLPGSGGRADVAARCVTSALLVSNAIRKDATVAFILDAGAEISLAVIILGASVRYLNPDERSTASLLRNALLRSVRATEGFSSPGIYFANGPASELLNMISASTALYYLKEDGMPVQSLKVPFTAFLGDHRDLTADEEKLLDPAETKRISVSGRSLHSDQCIVILNRMAESAD
jgi:tRNA (pseudouridine54-N1)-methyltransferase